MGHTPGCEFCWMKGSCLLSSQARVRPSVLKQLGFKKSSTVYSMDLPAEGVFVVRKGTVSLVYLDELGNSRIAKFVVPGQLMGLDALLQKRVRAFTAQCREDSILCFIPTDAFEQLLHRDIVGLWSLCLGLAEQVHDISKEKLQLSGRNVRKRLKFAIENLPAIPRSSNTNESVISIRQWELAQFVGTSCETVSRELRRVTPMRGKAEDEVKRAVE